MQNNFLTAQEVSDLYFNGKVSYDTILRMARAKRIPTTKVGAKYLFSVEALDNHFMPKPA